MPPSTLKLTASHARVPDSVNACFAGIFVTLVDVSVATVTIYFLITAELALVTVAYAAGRCA